MRFFKYKIFTGLLVLAATVAIAFFTRDYWQAWLIPANGGTNEGHAPAPQSGEAKALELSTQARKNLGLSVSPVALQPYWRTIQVPGVVIDRPGYSDHAISAPAVSVVAQVHAFPGDTVKPGARLFTLRLISEYIQNSQSELFKTTQEAKLVKQQLDRLEGLAGSGAIPEARLIEVENQLRRLNTAVQAYRQDLLTRGLTLAHLDSVAKGTFISEIEVVAPSPAVDEKELVGIKSAPAKAGSSLAYEVEDLKVELGQQVQAGQTLCLLSNHQSLYIKGNSFKREVPYLEEAAKKGWPIRVEFAEDANDISEKPDPMVHQKKVDVGEDDGKSWPPLEQDFTIRYLANTVDPVSRTFAFYLPLANQSRSYKKDGKTFLVWRFRPGQRVRLHVPVEEFKNVIVLPAGAVVRDGPEAYVFQQNGDLFHRISVHVLHEDRLNVVLANDGSIRPEVDYLAQNAAASLNRVLKAQNSGGGLPPGAHFHADGTLHLPGQ